MLTRRRPPAQGTRRARSLLRLGCRASSGHRGRGLSRYVRVPRVVKRQPIKPGVRPALSSPFGLRADLPGPCEDAALRRMRRSHPSAAHMRSSLTPAGSHADADAPTRHGASVASASKRQSDQSTRVRSGETSRRRSLQQASRSGRGPSSRPRSASYKRPMPFASAWRGRRTAGCQNTSAAAVPRTAPASTSPG